MKQMQETAEGRRMKELPEFAIRRETLGEFFERLQVINIITRTSHYESLTMRGTGFILNYGRRLGSRATTRPTRTRRA